MWHQFLIFHVENQIVDRRVKNFIANISTVVTGTLQCSNILLNQWKTKTGLQSDT